MSLIEAALLDAYRQARYEVRGTSVFTLRIDQYSPELHAAQRRLGVVHSAFITACNPRGRLLEAADNAGRQAALIRAIDDLGLIHWPGFGADPDGHWPGEPSVLAFGLVPAPARSLGLRFEQNAIVQAGADAVPRLMLLR